MKFPPLTVIEASAGTGKTFALVTRLLQLIFNGTEPERIVALTFSRLAAGEIFNSFIERLAQAAKEPRIAVEESERVGLKLCTNDFSEKLRNVINHQHLSMIGTLDSFLMRIVRMIPLELGLAGDISIMSDYQSPVERLRLVGEILMLESGDAKAVFHDAFQLTFGGADEKMFLESFAKFIEGWHMRYMDNGDVHLWGEAETIWGKDIPNDLEVTLASIRASARELQRFAGKSGADKFISAVAEFDGRLPDTFPKCMQDDSAFCEIVRKMCMWKIAQALKTTQGLYRLMHIYESIYKLKVRQKGRITFEDIPRLLNSISEGVRLPLEYRMDVKFDHWALDEFQDTSREQWRAIKNLIYESSHQDSGKSVFIVGDRKQSIYEWRGGDVRILNEQVREAQRADNRLLSLDESYRYVSEIAEAVNRVFGEAHVRGMIDMDEANDGSVWRFREHVSHDREKQGFVEVIQASKAGNQARISDFFEPIVNALKAVQPWERGITTAILVRKNKEGEEILAHLKAQGIDKVIFEGESKIADSPVISAMVELVKMAEYAEDKYAYEHIHLSPIGKAIYPNGVPPAAELSARLLEDFTKMGMVRKFREVREAIKVIPEVWNSFTESRFEDFIKCVAEFEMMRNSTMRLSDFITYLDYKMRRDYAEPEMVRIMTIHQSKGLGFKWVIAPLFEHDKLSSSRHIGPLEGEEPKWILSNPSEKAIANDVVLAKAERRRQQIQRYNSLCLYYVAMTRAEQALTLILDPLSQSAKGGKAGKAAATAEKFGDLVRSSGLSTSGRKDWYCDYALKKDDGQADDGEAGKARNGLHRQLRRQLTKLRPSEAAYTGLNGGCLFAEDFGKAKELGVEVHARYQQIEWATAEEAVKLPSAFREAFTRPSPEARAWRERKYELFMDGRWESGQFDRVVFNRSGDNLAATIYDFKTDGKHKGESDSEFLKRMQLKHSSQLTTYRRALAILTKIPIERITIRLLLESTGMALPL